MVISSFSKILRKLLIIENINVVKFEPAVTKDKTLKVSVVIKGNHTHSRPHLIFCQENLPQLLLFYQINFIYIF